MDGTWPFSQVLPSLPVSSTVADRGNRIQRDIIDIRSSWIDVFGIWNFRGIKRGNSRGVGTILGALSLILSREDLMVTRDFMGGRGQIYSQ